MPVSEGFCKVFTFEMLEGVVESMNEPDKVIMPQSVAEKIFGTESPINKKLSFIDRNFTVGGVYKDFPVNSSVRNSIYFSMGDENKDDTGNYNYAILVKLTSPDKTQEIIDNYKAITEKDGSKKIFGWDAADVSMRLTPFTELHYVKNVAYDAEEKASRQTILVMIAIAIVLLIIAGINFTNFSMALTPMRVKSINTQKVLGAGQGMLQWAVLSEAICICLLAFIGSLGLVYLFGLTDLRLLVDGTITLDAHIPIVLATAGIALIVALFAGLYPSYYMTSFPPALVLKGSFGLSPKGRVLRNTLLGFQFIASFALIIGAGFMYLQNDFIRTTNLGYNKDQLITAFLNSKLSKEREPVVNKLKQYAGIENVTCAQFMLSSSDRYMGWGRNYKDKEISFQCLPVDPSFLSVMGINIWEGRDFRQDDKRIKEGVYIFNQKAKTEFGLELGDKVGGTEVIGFIDDIKYASFRTEILPMAFYVAGAEDWDPLSFSTCLYVHVKAGTNLVEAYKYVERTLDEFDPGYPFKIAFFDNILQRTYEKEQNVTTLITLFSLIAIFVSIVGVFGLVIFESEYRIKEIGVRKVLGSSTGQIILMFNKVYLRILCICFILAAPLGYVIVKNWLENFVYRTPMHWWVFLISFIIVTVITILTVTFQNWRVANANPVESIKNE
ncbi:MAG: FtsX-like permease family protein [Tannerellaceae bacterium]|nr:FtsX-like permease family protein [Tannerellaceae bacterium]